MHYEYLIVGAGLSGATLAEHAARDGKRVLVIDQRDHVAGNCYDHIDTITGIRINDYGAHIFHTNDAEVWDYIQQFGTWKRWDHKVVADISGTYIPIPVTPTTVNTLFGESITNEEEMCTWLLQECPEIQQPRNSRDIALSRVGPRLYELLFETYTKKQWDKDPSELEPSVLSRIPVRTVFDDRYFSDKFQGLPADGYTALVEAMLKHPNISVKLNCSWEHFQKISKDTYDTLLFTGPIDQYFQKAGLPKLDYRSIQFEWQRFITSGYVQPNSVVNFPLAAVPYTRCVEYKHFLHQKSPWSIVAYETTTDKGEPYYPVPTHRNRTIYEQYRKLAEVEPNVHFIGRLANYKYFNMDQAIRNAMDYYRNVLAVPK